MYVDSSAIRAVARLLRERSGDIRAEAVALAHRADGVPWSGLAAGAMRRLVAEQLARLRGCAGAHEEAADALDRHARAVDHAMAAVAAIEHRVEHGVERVEREVEHWL